MNSTQDSTPATATKRAIKNGGGQSSLARKLKISPQAVQKWAKENRVSHKKVIQVEAETGVSRHELRPDIYPLPA